MKKRGGFLKIFLIAIIIVLALIIAALLLYIFTIKGKDNSGFYADLEKSGQLTNPILNMDEEKAVQQFNESFVYYLLYKIKAYNLHNPPVSSDTPKIELVIEQEVYSAEIIKGKIIVEKGAKQDKDILITTNKREAIKMLRNSSYIFESFSSGA